MAPVILVTNDDGIHARGLQVLADALAALGEVYVVAPDREQSAVGHALTLHRPLRVDRVAERKYAVNGTPSDCVNLAVLGLLPEPPVLVASGVNLAVARLLIGAGRQHASLTLEADGRHLMTDVWTSVGVVAGVVAVAVSGWDILDPLIALAVAANILLTGVSLVRRSTAVTPMVAAAIRISPPSTPADR